jgi:urease beta subunit
VHARDAGLSAVPAIRRYFEKINVAKEFTKSLVTSRARHHPERLDNAHHWGFRFRPGRTANRNLVDKTKQKKNVFSKNLKSQKKPL